MSELLVGIGGFLAGFGVEWGLTEVMRPRFATLIRGLDLHTVTVEEALTGFYKILLDRSPSSSELAPYVADWNAGVYIALATSWGTTPAMALAMRFAENTRYEIVGK